MKWHSSLRHGGCTASTGLPTKFGKAIQRIHIRDVDVSIPDLYGARLPQLPHGPGERLPVGSNHARQLLVGVAGGYHAAAVDRDNTLIPVEAEYQARKPGHYFLTNQIREPPLTHGEPPAKHSDGLYCHLWVAQHQILEVLPPKDEHGRW